MSDAPAGFSRPTREPLAMALIEEAVHLLRRAPLTTLAIYYAGAVPWALGFLFYCSYAAWFKPSGAELVWASLGLVVLFGVMKATQAVFCARLRAQRLGMIPPQVGWWRLALDQVRVQAWAPPGLAMSAVLIVPFGWAMALFQSKTVLAVVIPGGASPGSGAAHAARWPRQNHLGLAMLALVGAVVWINVAVSMHLIPWLANRLLGLENVAGLSGWSWINSTFLAMVTATTWLVLDPLVKAFYVLRVFYADACTSGADLMIEFSAAQPSDGARPPGRAATPLAGVGALVLIVGLGFPATGVHAAVDPSASAPAASLPASVDAKQLDAAIDAVLARSEFQWRLPPLPADPESVQPSGAFVTFCKQGISWVRAGVKGIAQEVERFVRWLVEWLSGRRAAAPAQRGGDHGATVMAVRVVLYGLVVLVVGLVGYLLFRAVRQKHQSPGVVVATTVAARPDLTDERLQAAQLPVEGWLGLAHEQMARGNWQLALRALYLATLARLGAEGLLTLTRFKTNRDYERELGRRAMLRAPLVAWFGARRREFEAVWYGRTEPEEARVRAWLADLEGGEILR